MRRWWIAPVSYALLMAVSVVKCGKDTNVMLEDIWGTLSLQAGENEEKVGRK